MSFEEQKWDLLPRILSYLDVHLSISVIDVLLQTNRYNQDDLQREKMKLLLKTKMVDSAIELAKHIQLPEETVSEIQKSREDVINELKVKNSQSKPLTEIFKSNEFNESLSSDRSANFSLWSSKTGATQQDIQILYDTGKIYFDVGNYEKAMDLLFYCSILSSDTEQIFNSTFGKMECEYLFSDYDTALNDLKIVKEILEKTNSTSSLLLLQRKAALLHWSLFIFKENKNENYFSNILETFTAETYKQVIEIMCPHLLRYLTVAAITQKRKKETLQEVARLIQQESESYRDPITEFFEALYINLDFDAAEQKLVQCEEVLKYDYFLESYVSIFFENARLFIFETYCKIHQRVDIGMLAQKLKMDSEEAEKWIVNLVRNAQLEAKIDSENNAVIMYQHTPNVYQQIIEKTKALSFRSHVIINNLKQETTTQDKTRSSTGYRGKKMRGGERDQKYDKK